MSRPLPDVHDQLFAPFWAATARNLLMVRRCADCGRYQWPPREVCVRCLGSNFDWVEASPRGRLHTWTVVSHQTMEGFEPPYIVALVDLDEPSGLRMLGNVVATAEDLEVGLPVTALFELHDGVRLVNWMLASP